MVLTDKLRRSTLLAVCALLLLASLVPLLSRQKAGAYALLTNREIRMSNSTNGFVDAIYLHRATVATTGNIGGMVVEFCSNSPIIGDSCTAPSGFTLDDANLVIANQTGITDFVVDTTNSDANTLILTRTAASVSSGTTITFELGNGGTNGVTNPTTTNTTFYARMLTYAATATAQAYTDTAPGASVDAGGVALSTAAQITVTAKVQERLTFCVYTDGDNNGTPGDANFTNCTGVGGTAIPLGDTNGVLSDTGEFVDINTMYNVSTNASSGVSIRVKGATLTSGGNTITGMGDTANTSTPGTEEFGFCTYRDTGGGAAGLTPVAPYDTGDAGSTCDTQTSQTAGTGSTGGAGTATFAFDTTTACGSTASAADFGENNLSCRYGDVIATKSAGSQSTGRVAFIGNISTTTEPGIYTSTLTFIATGVY